MRIQQEEKRPGYVAMAFMGLEVPGGPVYGGEYRVLRHAYGARAGEAVIFPDFWEAAAAAESFRPPSGRRVVWLPVVKKEGDEEYWHTSGAACWDIRA